MLMPGELLRRSDPIIMKPRPNIEKHNLASFFFVSGRTGGQELGKARKHVNPTPLLG